MFSFGKLVTLALLIGGIWMAMRWLETRRVRAERADSVNHARRERVRNGPEEPEDLIQCRVCGVYGPADRGRDCSRSDCPY